MALTEGPRPTENGNRRLNPLPRRDSGLRYRVCFARRRPLAPPGASGPSAVEVVEGLTPPRSGEPELGLRNFFRFVHKSKMGAAAIPFKG